MNDCKQQIINSIPNNSCCSFAFLNVVALSSQINKDFSNLLVSNQPFVLEKVVKIVSNYFPSIEINSWESFLLLKGNIYSFLVDINFKSKLDLSLYDNDCDSNCNICKTFRLTSHQYDNDEDYICNECFYERPPYVIGDISGDGSVDTTDLAVMKLFLAGIGDIDDTVKVAGDMTGDGQINTTDLAQLKLFLAGVDSTGSEVLTSEYTTQRFDKSYKNKKGEVLIEHYYDLIQLKGNSEAAQKINNSLKAHMDSFFMSNEELEEYADGAEDLGPYCYTMDAKVSHNAGGYICIVTSYDWYMGGVANFGYYGFTFNLSTGEPASLAELTGKTRISLENEIKTKVIEFFAEEYESDVIYQIKDRRLDDFEFFIENGEIVIVIPEYDIAPEMETIKTGISVK